MSVTTQDRASPPSTCRPHAEPRQHSYPHTATSRAEWIREPTTLQVIFHPALPYQPPRSAAGVFLWRRRVWFETTFALSMLEPWEKVLIMCIIYVSWGLVLAGIYLYFPLHLAYIHGRAVYYLYGPEDGASAGWLWGSSWAMGALSPNSTLGAALSLHGDL